MLKKLFKVTSLYGLMSLVSLLIRQQWLPTPAEAMGFNMVGIQDLIGVLKGEFQLSMLLTGLLGFVINFILEAPLHLITYFVVGLYYSRGEFPIWGCFLYLLFYLAHIGLLTIMGWGHFKWWVVTIVLVGYISIHILVNIKRTYANY